MKVSVIIVNFNVQHFLEVCVHAVSRAMENIAGEIIVVDNASSDGSLEMLATRFPSVKVIANEHNVGFSRANNQAYEIAQGEYVLILNPDTVMPEDFFTQTLDYMDAHALVGALGPRLLDGKGQFAPDSKKSFPTLSVALFKTTGLNKLFRRSPFFNKYYAVHIDEHQIAEVEVLSGCCMLLRKTVVNQIGGAFDEAYFMYCEDVDLSYRIKKGGYQNIYFPQVNLIHYKGESTRKATLSYVRIFNQALITFVKKHYTTTHARLFVALIHLGIALRGIISVVKNIVKALRMPLFDALALLLLLYTFHHFWVVEVREVEEVNLLTLLVTIPVYVFVWLGSMYLNGAYDRPYRSLRVIRGMLIGTVLNFAYFGLISATFRYSRGVLVFTGIGGSVALVALHELLYWLGILRFVRYNELPKKAVIIGSEEQFAATSKVLSQVSYAPELAGRVSAADATEPFALGGLEELRELLKALSIKEVIFCANDISYQRMLQAMEHCGASYEYKIYLLGARGFVGSNSSFIAGELYTIDRRYLLSDFAQQRNKRVFDLAACFTMLFFLPVLLFWVEKKWGWIKNIFLVIGGKRSWVGYGSLSSYQDSTDLPKIRKGILPCFVQQENFVPTEAIKLQQDILYAEHYAPGHDLNFLTRNKKYWGHIYSHFND